MYQMTPRCGFQLSVLLPFRASNDFVYESRASCKVGGRSKVSSLNEGQNCADNIIEFTGIS